MVEETCLGGPVRVGSQMETDDVLSPSVSGWKMGGSSKKQGRNIEVLPVQLSQTSKGEIREEGVNMVDEVVMNEGVENQAINAVGLLKNGDTFSENNFFCDAKCPVCCSKDEEGVFGLSCNPTEEFSPVPLCSVFPDIEWDAESSDWVLRKVDEIKVCGCVL
ncbi:hypothetical protein CIPAW_03G177400 [Carya illinoinensis]|uniref:Uncharacterized protein n=1 Tax=Carya illinoinensis TaxID=32201 RepID=A0A8T1R5T5_CARIL|nr:hypothetical protein CIPAW_03G177400 [Carya illinoinensis]